MERLFSNNIFAVRDTLYIVINVPSILKCDFIYDNQHAGNNIISFGFSGLQR